MDQDGWRWMKMMVENERNGVWCVCGGWEFRISSFKVLKWGLFIPHVGLLEDSSNFLRFYTNTAWAPPHAPCSNTAHDSCAAHGHRGGHVVFSDVVARLSGQARARCTGRVFVLDTGGVLHSATGVAELVFRVSAHGHFLQGRALYTARVLAALLPLSLFWLVLPHFNSELRSAFSYIFLIHIHFNKNTKYNQITYKIRIK